MPRQWFWKRMARVFTNLIKNACHYSEGEIIRIICKKENDYVQITFENKGDVPEEHHPNKMLIFYIVVLDNHIH